MGIYIGSSTSYCDDCIHKKVCKYLNEVQNYEQQTPIYSTGVGPSVSYQINCTMKLVGEAVPQKIQLPL